jgi:hypothetical protein
MEDLIAFYNKKKFNVYKDLDSRQDLIQRLLALTSFLGSATIRQRYWHVINRRMEVIKCQVCGEPARWDDKHFLYRKSCANASCVEKLNSITHSKRPMQHDGRRCDFCGDLVKLSKKHGYGRTCGRAECLEMSNVVKSRTSITLSDLFERTSFLDPVYRDVSVSQRMWHVISGDFSIQTCKACHRPSMWSPSMKRYRASCGEACRTAITRMSASETIMERYGVGNIMELGEVKSFQTKLNSEKFGRLIGDEYELLKYGDECTIRHRACGSVFTARRDLIGERLRRYRQEICTSCNPTRKEYSFQEKQLADYVRSIYGAGEIVENCKSLIPPYEVDLYLPGARLAIEYNGLYWHSEERKPRAYHKIKSDMCAAAGVHLVHVWEDDWRDRNLIIRGILAGMVGKNSRVYARDCLVHEIGGELMRDFLISNHLQGAVMAYTLGVGLFHRNQMLGVMAVRRRAKNLELIRMCFKSGVSVVGGASKMLSAVRAAYPLMPIRTYCDIGTFRGDVYEKLGFSLTGVNPPNYSYTDGATRIPKQALRPGRLLVRGDKERKYALTNGLMRVYNSGVAIYDLL